MENINKYSSLSDTYKIDREKSNEITGYASIDRPWKKYYKEIPTKQIELNQTIYEMIFEQENMDALALGYLGTDLTYKELKKYVDRFADALVKNNIKKGDVVLMGVSNSIGMMISLLAINKIGAVSKWFDIRASKKDIEEYANSSNCKCMIAFDMLMPKIENVVEETSIEKVIIINPADYLPKYKKALYNLKCKKEGTFNPLPNKKEFVYFEDFLKEGSKKSDITCAPFDAERPSIMIQSSGTTGKPKTIVHSDLSAVSSTMQLAYSDLPLGKEKTILVALPPWIAYGLGNATIMAMSFGTKVELCPNFDPDAVYKNLGKFTISFAAPFHYRYLRDNYGKLTEKELSALKQVECMVTGGDKVTIEENEEFEAKFNCPVVNGYGNNEGWGALTVNPTKHNSYGTVGIPKYGDTIISYDENSKSENKYYELGEICSLTDTKMLHYQDNEDETKRVLQMHDDGKVWIHTGDLGYIDEEGYVHLSGRASRVIVRLGFKISAYTIEDKISEHYAVKECVTVSVKDREEEHVPMSYVVLKDEYKFDFDKMKEDIFQKCYMELKEYEVPKHIMIMDNLPYTQNNKYDFRMLEKMGNEYVLTLSDKTGSVKKTKKR